MSEENAAYLTPAQVAELLAVPPSTLRTYANKFGRLLSHGAQGDPAVAGRAFRHRRYTRDDLKVLSRAKTLVDAGLSYRAALAELSGVEPGTVDRRRPRTRSARGENSMTPPPTAPISDSRIQIIADPAAGEAIQNLAGVVRRLVNVIEDVNSRIGRLEDQIDSIRVDAQRRDVVEGAPPGVRKHWLHRLLQWGR